MKGDRFFRVEDSYFPRKHSLNVRGKLFTIDRPLIMAILNITPDSFYAGSRHSALSETLFAAGRMIAGGAAILDIGGYSTRPGAAEVSESEELDRVIPVAEALAKEFPGIPLSIDTFRSSVAKAAIEAGAGLVNDVSGGDHDDRMFETVASLGCPYVLMHSRGNPQTMNSMTDYDNLFRDVAGDLSRKAEQLRKLGVNDIIIDPGFGFAKTAEQNFALLNMLGELKALGHPVLAGLSRKSTVWKTLRTTPEKALNGTTVLNTVALLNGADILRVHDVREAAEAIELISNYQKADYQGRAQ
jgi:dihydropteroate synthase